jgi:hypothetical protein
MSASGPNTRGRKRKADQIDSETPSVNEEPVTQASSLQDLDADGDATAEAQVKVDSLDELKAEEQEQDIDQNADQGADQDADQDVDQDDDQDQEQQVTVSRRGRPPGRGKGAGRGGRGGGRGGRGRGRGKSGLSRQDSGIPETAVKKSGGRGGRGKKTSANHMVQVAYDRQADLKQNYKEVARIVRVGLDLLAEKSLDMLRDDPLHHTKVREFRKVSRDLDNRRNAVISSHEKLYAMKVEHAKKEKEMNDEYTKLEFEVSQVG